MAIEAVMPSILEKFEKSENDNVKVFIKHIIDNGKILSHTLSNEYGVKQAYKVAKEAKNEGFPLISYKVKSEDGRYIQAYKFPEKDESNNIKNGYIWKNEKIGSIKTFIETIESLNLDKPSKYAYFFRGHADYKKFKLEPSIYREKRWIENENKMFREVIIKCPSDFKSTSSTFEKLVKMQHYSLPTRLLDITENPLVALYFACDKKIDEDGEVIIFRIPKTDIKYYDSDTVSVISNISKRPSDFDISKLDHSDKSEFNKKDEIKYLLHEIKEEKPYFEANIEPKHINSVVCVKPKLDNPRVIRQDGAFFIFGMDNKKTNKASIPEEYRVTGKSMKLIINKAKKEKILKQLAALGISDAKMFPEIDSVSNYLKSNFNVS